MRPDDKLRTSIPHTKYSFQTEILIDFTFIKYKYYTVIMNARQCCVWKQKKQIALKVFISILFSYLLIRNDINSRIHFPLTLIYCNFQLQTYNIVDFQTFLYSSKKTYLSRQFPTSVDNVTSDNSYSYHYWIIHHYNKEWNKTEKISGNEREWVYNSSRGAHQKTRRTKKNE